MSNKCTYCMKESDNLKRLPPELKGLPNNRYCEKCYPTVLQDVKNLPWNKKTY